MKPQQRSTRGWKACSPNQPPARTSKVTKPEVTKPKVNKISNPHGPSKLSIEYIAEAERPVQTKTPPSSSPRSSERTMSLHDSEATLSPEPRSGQNGPETFRSSQDLGVYDAAHALFNMRGPSHQRVKRIEIETSRGEVEMQSPSEREAVAVEALGSLKYAVPTNSAWVAAAFRLLPSLPCVNRRSVGCGA
ncbi:uncharacterized protein M421DRAFT_3699 [Didymella exigua CBS 183.55]|uniref:Uncharacterized protein n=1 Tax=Didymella exigua CBS 183.55 TaxID=1150837 RepID=A0A6A5RNE0_9PLEO|nr:uncharacterized protein M421DRAFT_3699 [Didymella exigua CBS 183.55]KAF1929921.1 hypothetical protein M421DRAFT_3699 [Didymella exigua CBS 183.55]